MSGRYIQSLEPIVQQQVISVYREALKVIWVGAGASGCREFFAVWAEKHIPLRPELNTQVVIKAGKIKTDQ